MFVFIMEPTMTMADSKYTSIFHKELLIQLSKYGVANYLVTRNNVIRLKNKISCNSIVVIYSSHYKWNDIPKDAQEFLRIAIEEKAQIWPVAMDKESRIPMGIIANKQSYDVWEQLRCRDLDEKYLGTIAKMFSRKIIARFFPTFYCEESELFFSHRRVDGEEITAKIYDKICVQAKETTLFRDVANVKVGDNAQVVIDQAMANSDVFVFIHTSKSAESDWILKELRFALLRGIPILWIQIDNADIHRLRLKPSESPHLQYKMEDFDNDQRLTEIVDEILHKSFELIMDRSNRVFGYLDCIQEMFEDKIEILDQEKMIYHISMPRKGYYYPQRKIEQYCQVFGRTPTVHDAENLYHDLENIDADSIVILTNRIVKSSKQKNVIIDGIENFFFN